MHRSSPHFLFRPIIRLLASGALLLLGLCPTSAQVISGISTPETPAVPSARAARNLNVFDRAWDLVNQKYYDAKFHGVDWAAAAAIYRPKAAAAADDTALHKTINAMLNLLQDRHTRIWTAARARELLTEKSVDIGAYLILLENRYTVCRVVPGSPADSAGVKPGWIWLTLDGQPWQSANHIDPVNGKTLRLGFLDVHDRPVSLALKLRTIAPKPERRMLPGGAVYLRFDRFNFSNTMWFCWHVSLDIDEPAIVIDLRGNPGGDLNMTRVMLAKFFDHPIDYGEFVTRIGRVSDIHTPKFSLSYQGPLAILVDASTGSAAEIFTAILQRQHRAIVVGRPTAGTVLSAEFYSLPDGSKLELSIEDYTLPGGQHLEGQGVKPDMAAPLPTLANLRTGRDPDLDAAMSALAK